MCLVGSRTLGCRDRRRWIHRSIKPPTQASQNFAGVRKCKRRSTRCWASRKRSLYFGLPDQCDQMARLYFQYLANKTNENFPNRIILAKVGSTLCQILDKACFKLPKAFKILTKRRNFTKSGHTVPDQQQAADVVGRSRGPAQTKLTRRSHWTKVRRSIVCL